MNLVKATTNARGAESNDYGERGEGGAIGYGTLWHLIR